MKSDEIGLYLTHKTANKKGICRHCKATVSWTVQKLFSHKRANCPNLSDAEKFKFAGFQSAAILEGSVCELNGTESDIVSMNGDATHKRKLNYAKSSTSGMSSNYSKVSKWVDVINNADKDICDKALVNFVFRTGIPFRVVQSNAFKDFVTKLRPSYASVMAGEKVIRTRLLDSVYSENVNAGILLLENSVYYSIVSDWWSNMRNEHLVNFIILTPKHSIKNYYNST